MHARVSSSETVCSDAMLRALSQHNTVGNIWPKRNDLVPSGLVGGPLLLSESTGTSLITRLGKSIDVFCNRKADSAFASWLKRGSPDDTHPCICLAALSASRSLGEMSAGKTRQVKILSSDTRARKCKRSLLSASGSAAAVGGVALVATALEVAAAAGLLHADLGFDRTPACFCNARTVPRMSGRRLRSSAKKSRT